MALKTFQWWALRDILGRIRTLSISSNLTTGGCAVLCGVGRAILICIIQVFWEAEWVCDWIHQGVQLRIQCTFTFTFKHKTNRSNLIIDRCCDSALESDSVQTWVHHHACTGLTRPEKQLICFKIYSGKVHEHVCQFEAELEGKESDSYEDEDWEAIIPSISPCAGARWGASCTSACLQLSKGKPNLS